ncbi:MAG TPA: hypothetical protein VLA97_12975 [Nocardioidaceae bacterium]|nr:hypothetical protein [Nocardioidaceae bacterium]
MSNAERVAIEETHTPANGAGPSGRRIAVAAGLALLLVSLGYVIGVRSSWTAHHPSAVSGMAERVPANVPYAYFDPESGGRVGFRLDDVVWKAGDETDAGSIPPCLREPGDRVAVHAGVIEVARPYGSGSYQQVLSVTCPT